MWTNLSLKSKGLLLVAVPLLSQLVFVALLVHFMQQADLESQREIRSKNIIIYAQSVLANMYQAAVSVMRFRGGGDPAEGELVDTYLSQTREDVKQLESQLQFEQSELQSFPPHRDMILRQLKGLAWRKGEIARGRPDPLTPEEKLVHYREMGEVVEYFRSLADRQKQRAAVQFEAAQKTRRTVTYVVFGAVSGTLFIGVSVALIFSSSILKRIGVLNENARRLSRSVNTENLIAPLTGRDEVAELDKVFHSMAAKLEEAMRKEKAVVDNAPDLICSIDTEGRFLRVNPAVEHVLSRSHAELTGQDSSLLFTWQDFKTASDEKNEFRFDSEIRSNERAGGKEHFSWTGQWSPQEECYFLIGRNVTLERQLEQFKQELMEMVSHDLRTPLSSIRTGMELMLEGAFGELSEKGMKKLDSMNSNVSSLVKLVNDLLDLHRSEAGSLSVTRETTEVMPIIANSLNAVQQLADAKKIAIVTDCRVDIVKADPDRLEQVLLNFLGNALKFSPEGSEIKVEVISLPDGTEFRVSDRGRGVPAHLSETIFDRFSQVDPDNPTERKGTGLGLAIAKAIVLAHDGELGVRANDGGGSIFWFKIPAEAEA